MAGLTRMSSALRSYLTLLFLVTDAIGGTLRILLLIFAWTGLFKLLYLVGLIIWLEKPCLEPIGLLLPAGIFSNGTILVVILTCLPFSYMLRVVA